MLNTFGPTDAVFEVLQTGGKAAPNDPELLLLLSEAHLERAAQLSSEHGADKLGGDGNARRHFDKAVAAFEAIDQRTVSKLLVPKLAVLEGHLLMARSQGQLESGAAKGSETLSLARKAYRRAIRADETMAEAYYALGLTYLLEDNGSKEPIGVLEAASYLVPLSTRAPMALARLRLARGEHEAAEAPLRYALQVGAHSGDHEAIRVLLQQASAAE